MKATLVSVVVLCAGQARADFTYLSQSGSATASYSIASATPPAGSASWTEPTGFVDYHNQEISSGIGIPGFGTLESVCTMLGTFHPTFLELSGGTGSMDVSVGMPPDFSSGSQSRSVMFRNDTSQLWPIVGVLKIGTPGGGATASVAYSLKGSDGSDTELTAISETDFSGQIKPGVTYTLALMAASSIPGTPTGGAILQVATSFDVKIGTVPEPSTLALALAGVLVSMLLRRA